MVKKEGKSPRRSLGRGLSALVSPEYVSINKESSNKADSNVTNIESSSAALKLESGDVFSSLHSEKVESLSPKNNENEILFLSVDKIKPAPNQPRKVFNEEELEELSASIKDLGVFQPLIVQKVSDEEFLIVAGERRWRASQKAGLLEVPVIVRELTQKEVLQISIVENVQRSQLNPLEEANAYQRLIEEFQLTQEEVASLVGKKRASVANSLRILKLDPEVAKMVNDRSISFGHARALVSVKDTVAQRRIAKRIVEEGLSVRAVESLIPQFLVLDSGKGVKQKIVPEDSVAMTTEFLAIEDRLREFLGTKVKIKQKVMNGSGSITLNFGSDSELTRLLDRICNDTELDIL